METKRPIIGEECLLYLGSEKSVKGFYLGFIPNKTDWYFKIDSPEGHLFVSKKDKGMEFYCTRENGLEETWLSEGDDGPDWPVGIPVGRIEMKLKNQERTYLEQIVNKWLLKKAA